MPRPAFNATRTAIAGKSSSVRILSDRLTTTDRPTRNETTFAEFHDQEVVGVAIAVGVLLSIFILAAIVGNILVIVAIITERNLRRAGNNFFISLAVADALVACLVMTFAAANDLTDRWSFGSVWCVVWQSSDVMCCTASILSICAVSLDRYINIRDPLRYRSLVTHRRSLVAVAVIWTMSAILSFLPISLGWHRLGKTTTAMNGTGSSPDVAQSATAATTAGELTRNSSAKFSASNDSRIGESVDGAEEAEEEEVCLLDFSPWYAGVSSLISFYVPCVVMLVIYTRLYLLSRKHRKSMTSITAGGGGGGGEVQRSRSPIFPSSEAVDGGGDGCATTAMATLRAAHEERYCRRSNADLCPNRSRIKQRSELSRTVSDGIAGGRRSKSYFDFQAVPVVTISSCSSSGFDGVGGNEGFGGRRCSDASIDAGAESVIRGTRRLLGTQLLSGSGSTISLRTMLNHRPSIVSGAAAALVRHQTDHKAAITVGCIIGIFLFCWGPFFVINIIGSVWEGSVAPVAFTFFTWLGYINSCVNPVIYGVTNAEFRRAFLRILTSRCYSYSYSSDCSDRRSPAATDRRQDPTDNNNCYRQVRTNDSPLIAYGNN